MLRVRDTYRGRVRIFAVAVLSVAALAIGAAAAGYLVDNAALRRDGVVTTGTVVEHTYGGRWGDVVDGYVVRYSAPGGAPRTGEVLSGDDDPVLAVGESLDVLVNPAEPGDVARADSGPDDTEAVVSVVLTVLAALGAVAAAPWRSRSRPEDVAAAAEYRRERPVEGRPS